MPLLRRTGRYTLVLTFLTLELPLASPLAHTEADRDRPDHDPRLDALSAAFAAFVRHASAADFEELTALLDRSVVDADADDETLDDWGRLRVLTMYEQVRGDVHTVGWLEEHGVSRQRVNQWRSAGRLYGMKGVPGVRGFAYPRWQFDDTLHPREFMPAVTAAAEDARLDPLALHLLMTNPAAGGGQTAIALVERGDTELVERLIRAAGSQD
jgi:hypothetical protein